MKKFLSLTLVALTLIFASCGKNSNADQDAATEKVSKTLAQYCEELGQLLTEWDTQIEQRKYDEAAKTCKKINTLCDEIYEKYEDDADALNEIKEYPKKHPEFEQTIEYLMLYDTVIEMYPTATNFEFAVEHGEIAIYYNLPGDRATHRLSKK